MFSSTKKCFYFGLVVLLAVNLLVLAACAGINAEMNAADEPYPNAVAWRSEAASLRNVPPEPYTTSTARLYGQEAYDDTYYTPELHPDAVAFKYMYEALNIVYRSEGVLHRYVYIPEDNNMRFIDYYGIVDLLTDGTGVFMFGRYACSWCRMAAPVWVDFARDKGIYIYYFNPTYDRENDTEIHQSLLTLLHDYLPINNRDQDITGDDFDPEWKRITVPHFFFVYEGEVRAHWMANSHELLRGDYDLEAVRERFDYMYYNWRELRYVIQEGDHEEYFDDCLC